MGTLVVALASIGAVATAEAHPFVVEAAAVGVPLTGNEQLVTFQCSALDAVAPLGTRVKDCYVKSAVDAEHVDSTLTPANNLKVGTAVLVRGQFHVRAGGTVQHPLGVFQELGTTCTTSPAIAPFAAVHVKTLL